MNDGELQGRWALVTGASSGIGVDFARELAARGCNLVLVARRESRLLALETELRRRHGIEVRVLPFDLVPVDAATRLCERLRQEGLSIDVLVNNAGSGVHGEFRGMPWQRLQEMLTLDIVTLTGLTRLLLDDMLRRNFGYILLVASTAAYQPVPRFAAYAAAKSYVLSFGEALNAELRQTRVQCTVVSPGFTATEFQGAAGHRVNPIARRLMMNSASVARIGVQGMLAGRATVVTGRLNAVTAAVSRMAPHRISLPIVRRLAG